MSPLYWLLALTKKLLINARVYTLLMVFFGVAFQFITLLAMMAPLKLVFLMSAGHAPGFFPLVLQSIEFKWLVSYLCLAAVLLVPIRMSLGVLVKKLALCGSQALQLKASKLQMLPDQVTFAQDQYALYGKVVSCFIFSLIALILLFFVYFDLAVSVAIFLLLLVLFVIFWARTVGWGQLWFLVKLKKLTPLAMDFAFFIGFFYIFYEYWVGFLPAPLALIISLLVLRQMLSRLGWFFTGMVSLFERRSKLQAIFFFRHDVSSVATEDSAIYSLLAGRDVKDVLRPLVSDFSLTLSSVEIMPISIRNTVMFKLSASNEPGTWVLKLIDKPAQHFARHEAELLLLNSLFAGACSFNTGVFNGVLYHLYKLSDDVVTEGAGVQLQEDFICQLVNLRLPVDLERKYRRSHKSALEVLTQVDPDLLALYGLPDDAIERFFTLVSELGQKLSNSRWIVHNPRWINSVVLGGSSKIACLDWTRWVYEPIGYLWPLPIGRWDSLYQKVSKRVHLESKCEDIRLFTVISHVGEAIKNQNYVQAVAYIKEHLK